MNRETHDTIVFFLSMFIIAGIILSVFSLIFAIGDYYEVKAFNRIHGTDYRFSEWYFAENTIKEYHLGKVENINLNIDGLEGLR